MTRDFLEDAADACTREGWNYLIVVAPPGAKNVLVYSNLKDWKTPEGVTIQEDIIAAAESTGAFNRSTEESDQS